MASTYKAAVRANRTATLADRAVHIKIAPRIRDMRESRVVLRLLKTFGDVVQFRNLRYDDQMFAPHTVIAIFQKPESAAKLISQSPLTISIDPPPPPAMATGPGTLGVSSLLPHNEAFKQWQKASSEPDGTSTMKSSEAQDGSGGNPQQTFSDATDHANLSDRQGEVSAGASIDNVQYNGRREHVLTVDSSRQDHNARLQRQKYYWGFEQKRWTIPQKDLAANVPAEGMSTIEASPGNVGSHRVNVCRAELRKRKPLREVYQEALEQEARNDASDEPVEHT